MDYVCQLRSSNYTSEFNIQAGYFTFLHSLCQQKTIQKIFLDPTFLKLLKTLLFSPASTLVVIQNVLSACLNFLIDYPQKYTNFSFLTEKIFLERVLKETYYNSRHCLFDLFLNFIQAINFIQSPNIICLQNTKFRNHLFTQFIRPI